MGESRESDREEISMKLNHNFFSKLKNKHFHFERIYCVPIQSVKEKYIFFFLSLYHMWDDEC